MAIPQHLAKQYGDTKPSKPKFKLINEREGAYTLQLEKFIRLETFGSGVYNVPTFKVLASESIDGVSKPWPVGEEVSVMIAEAGKNVKHTEMCRKDMANLFAALYPNDTITGQTYSDNIGPEGDPDALRARGRLIDAKTVKDNEGRFVNVVFYSVEPEENTPEAIAARLAPKQN